MASCPRSIPSLISSAADRAQARARRCGSDQRIHHVDGLSGFSPGPGVEGVRLGRPRADRAEVETLAEEPTALSR